MKTKNLNILIATIILISCLFITKVNALVDPTSEFYVNDYANILSPETEKYIVEKSKELYKVDGTQIVVVTVPNLEGTSLEEYSLEIARSFHIGSKEKNNGLLLLIALEERKSRVEVGTGLEGILPDGKTGRFQDQYMIPFFKQNDFDTGIRNGYDAFFNEIVKLNNLDLEASKLKTLAPPPASLATTILLRLILFVVLGFVIGLLAKYIEILKDIPTKIYLILGIVLIFLSWISNSVYFSIILFHVIGFIFGRFVDISGSAYPRNYGGTSSSWSSSDSSSSSSSSSGGDFSGGGSSRGF